MIKALAHLAEGGFLEVGDQTVSGEELVLAGEGQYTLYLEENRMSSLYSCATCSAMGTKMWRGLAGWSATVAMGARPTMSCTCRGSGAGEKELPYICVHPRPGVHHDPEGHGAHGVADVGELLLAGDREHFVQHGGQVLARAQ